MDTTTNVNSHPDDGLNSIDYDSFFLGIDRYFIYVHFFVNIVKISSSNDALNIEKKLRVEDYRLLRQRFNRSAAESADLSNKPSDKATSKRKFFLERLNYY